jgi:4-amino-4-deoxy-L-arabinose transferase-like glycosyltransferase
LLFCLAAYNFFYKLGLAPVGDWDEARYGVNAYEMLQSHDFGICTYNHEADYPNLKPPLGPWCIILGYRLFGFNALGLRFYSALSCLAVVGLLLAVLPKALGKIPALLAGFVLVLTPPFVYVHAGRTGDLCSLFCLFYVLFLVCVFKIDEKRKEPFFSLAGLCFALGFLVYSYHSAQMLIVLAAYLFFTGLYLEIPAKKYTGFFLCALLPVAGWAVWRGSYPDGMKFLKITFIYDVVTRSTQQIEGHIDHMDYYLVNLGKWDPYWCIYFVLALFLLLSVVGFKLDFKNKPLTLMAMGTLTPLVLFTLARTRLVWYINPLYPPLAALTGWLTFRIMKDPKFQQAGKNILILFLAIALVRSERELWKVINKPDPSLSQQLMGELATMNVPPHTPIFMKDLGQGDFFVAEVVCGMNPESYGKLEECLNANGFLMLEKDSKNENETFIRDHHLNVFLQNEKWMLVKL